MTDLTSAEQFLKSKKSTLETASQQLLSDANSYETCYNWYINNQKVLPENADLAAAIFIQKYALHDTEGMCLESTPEDMWNRIASSMAKVEMDTNKQNTRTEEEWKTDFYNILVDFKAVPGGSALSVIGNPYINSSCSNCFVVGTEDSLEGIMKTASDMARLQSYRGGTGIDISVLRPAGATVFNSAKRSTGAVSFMDFFSKVTSTIGQAGRCLREDQKVLTQTGLVSIKDIKSGDNVWSSKGWLTTAAPINNGIKPVFKITTARGLEIVATNNHIFTCMESYEIKEKQVKDFCIGDSIVILPGKPIHFPLISLTTDIFYDQGHGAINKGNRLNKDITFPTNMTENLAYLIGYAFGDGYVARDSWGAPESLSLACSHDWPEIQNKLVKISQLLFGYTPKINKGDGAVNKVALHSKYITLFMEKNGILKQKHHSLIMPEIIKQSNTAVQMSFISGYFDADGYASGSKKGYVIASVCHPILKEMQKLLLAAGIVSHITKEERKQETHKDLFSLSITGTTAQTIMLDLLKDSIKIQDKSFISKRDTILTPFNPKALGIKYNNYSFVGDNNHNISASAYTKLKILHEIQDELLVLDTVSSIEALGEAQVYDLQLASHHLFYCEGFNVHNSGATMISMDSHHPDIEAFIEEKQDLDKNWFFDELKTSGININDWKYTAISSRLKSTTKANVSVKVYDDFMAAVEKDTDYELWYEFIDNKYPRISKTIKAKQLWDKLIKANVSSAEPGILFWDTIIRESVSDCYKGKKQYNVTLSGTSFIYEHDLTTTGTNPCSELPLPVGSACTLLSQNLPKYVSNPWTKDAQFDFASFSKDIRLSTRLLDNIKEYDVSRLPLLVNKIDAVLCRRIGLGCHGLADTLAMLGLKYDTPEAIRTATSIYNSLANTVYDESVTLGIEKGTFQIWDWNLEKNNPFLNRLDAPVLDRIRLFGRRNIACLTSAPTGSISILSRNCSSGIEPVFKLEYLRNVKKQGSEETIQYAIYHQAFQDCVNAGGDTSIFIEAENIDWNYRIQMQAAIQLNIDHSISSTINLPENTTEQTVSDIYLSAWKAGLKGITTYISGCRSGVLVSNNKKEPIKHSHKIIERPKTTEVDIFKTKYKDKNYMVLVGRVGDKPIEIFGGEEDGLSLPTKYHKATLTKKSRGHYSLVVQLSDDPEDVLKINNLGARFNAADVITLTRMISLSLRNGISISDVVEQLSKAQSSLYDAPAVFARILKQYISDDEIISKETAKNKLCPECGKELTYKRESGCLVEICSSCNYSNSKCG